MCDECGCSEPKHEENIKVIDVKQSVFAKNNEIAHRNHHWFHDHKVFTLNMMSSPGSGKTTLLEKTVKKLNNSLKTTILVGDQQTDNDASRLKIAGANVKQINTNSCHLDAEMIEKELNHFVTAQDDLLIIENVGNLVCPASFDLGENKRVALLSTTEGEDKPLKYPNLFHRSELVIITKMDLAPYLEWDREKTYEAIRKVSPNAVIIELSSKTGEGLDHWVNWVRENCQCV